MRFDRIMDHLEEISKTQVRYATSESYLGSDQLFGLTNAMLQGLAVLRSRARASVPTALGLIDRSIPGDKGGTASFLEAWSSSGYPSREIDLSELRTANQSWTDH